MLTFTQQLVSNELERQATRLLELDSKREFSKLPPSKYELGRVYVLQVPYVKKDQVKALGAKWDYETKTWQCPEHLDANIFKKFKPVLLTDEFVTQKKNSLPKPVLRYKNMGITGKNFKPLCHCEMPPWEDCEHSIKSKSIIRIRERR